MRHHGTLVKWNAERGFGFIAPASGADELFVHVSAFPRDGRPPRVQEVLSYEVDTAPDGRTRAVAIQRTGQASAAKMRPARRPASSGRPVSHRLRWLPAAAVIAIALAAFWPTLRKFSDVAGGVSGASPAAGKSAAVTAAGESRPASAAGSSKAEEVGYRCDGRTRCSQMHSCAEATWVLRHCPGTQMDGDGDGIPCEQQWCGG